MIIKWLFETALIGMLSLPVAVLPERISLRLGEFFGILVFYLWANRRNIAIENIRRSELENRKDAERIVKESFRNIGKSFVEVARIYYGTGRNIIQRVEIIGAEHYYKAKSKNRGVVFITGHCGNWELLALAFGAKIDNIAVVARRQNNPYLNRFIENVRAKFGNRMIYKQGALKGIISELKRNGCVGILMDQAVLKDEGFKIDFIGRPAWTTKMPSIIARKTGAAVIPAFIRRTGDRHVINIYPEIDLTDDDIDLAIERDTKRFSGYIEDYIKKYPSQWLWIHRRWKRT